MALDFGNATQDPLGPSCEYVVQVYTSLQIPHIRLGDVNNENFNRELSRFEIPQLNADIDMTVTQMVDVLYNCAFIRTSVSVTPAKGRTVRRQERLLRDTYERRMLQAGLPGQL